VFDVRALGEIKVKGKEEQVTVYEVVGVAAEGGEQ
jgi:hypothetical protein